jgi:hypothetical protein
MRPVCQPELAIKIAKKQITEFIDKDREIGIKSIEFSFIKSHL